MKYIPDLVNSLSELKVSPNIATSFYEQKFFIYQQAEAHKILM